jgi:hypothetical protein
MKFIKTFENYNEDFLRKEIEDVLWKRDEPTSAMSLNKSAIDKLEKNGLIESPYNGERDERQIVDFVLSQLKGKEKEALNLLPYKTPYDKHEWSKQRDAFDKSIGLKNNKMEMPIKN